MSTVTVTNNDNGHSYQVFDLPQCIERAAARGYNVAALKEDDANPETKKTSKRRKAASRSNT